MLAVAAVAADQMESPEGFLILLEKQEVGALEAPVRYLVQTIHTTAVEGAAGLSMVMELQPEVEELVEVAQV
jgi:hypothetical protein